jgi:GAF domain-containing protein
VNNDRNRLLTVKRYKEVSAVNAELYNITALAAEICDASIAIISLIDDEVETFIAARGTDKQYVELDRLICISEFLSEPVLTISDVANHKRYTNTDLASIAPCIRFYAGATLTAPNGYIVGRLYVLDQKPRTLTKGQESCLAMLAKQVIQSLEKDISIKSSQDQIARLLSHQVRQQEALY